MMVAALWLSAALSQTPSAPQGPIRVGPSGAPPADGRVVQAKAAPAYKIVQGKGVARLYLNATNGSAEVAVSVLTLQRGAQVAEHVHEGSAEILYVIDGTAEMTIAGRRVALTAGDAVQVPKATRHSATATSDFKAVQVYAPAGPEQRFAAGERVQD